MAHINNKSSPSLVYCFYDLRFIGINTQCSDLISEVRSVSKNEACAKKGGS